MKGLSVLSLLYTFPLVSLAQAGLTHSLFPGSVFKSAGPHVGPSKRASGANSTLWVIEDTYEGQTFFECVACASQPSSVLINTKYVQLLYRPGSYQVRMQPS